MARVTWVRAVVGGVVGLLASAGPGRADQLTGTRQQPLVEVSHTVDISIADGVAIYKVQRQFANPGTIADEAGLAIDLPTGGAATGLRIRAKDRWYDGELMEREAAAKLYQEMTGLGAHKPKDPALLQWQWADKLYLQVFPVMPGQVSTVEYTLTVPTRYTNGKYWLSYPRVDAAASAADATATGSRPLATPTITVHAAWGNAQTFVTIDGQRVAPDTSVVLTPPVHAAWESSIADIYDASASLVASTLEIPAAKETSGTVTSASLMLDIAHTYQSDLSVVLITPQGKTVPLLERTGGSENTARATKTITLPPGTTPAGTWRVVASDHAGLDTGSIDAWSLTFGTAPKAAAFTATDTPVFIPDAPEGVGEAGVAAITVEPPAITTWLGRYGRVIASTQHAFGRLEVDVAPRLSEVPAKAQIVFVLDASYSARPALVDAQLSIIEAYLTHVPDAAVEIIAARRHATPVFGSFIPAADVHARIGAARTAAAFALGNGSALDEGATVAAKLLADRKGPRRVVLLTDELLRSSLSERDALASLAKLSPDTVVHVVVPELVSDSHPSLVREGHERLSPLATKHRGILARVSGLPVMAQKDLEPVVLELVRPTRIDNLTVKGALVDLTVLHEGDGIRVFSTGDTVAGAITLKGELWSVPVTKTLEPSPAFLRATAAFVFGADEHQGLTDAEMMKVALMGRAVSPVTSYVAAEPGTRPSTIGLARYSTTGHGSGYGSGSGSMYGSNRSTPELAALIDARDCVTQFHPAEGWRVTLEVETTLDEVVDVSTADPSPLAACLVETTWALRLDAGVYNQSRESFTAVITASNVRAK